MKNSTLVYSTDDSTLIGEESVPEQRISPGQQMVKLHLDRRGGGKIISVVRGLQEPELKLKSLATELKKACGVGGSSKNGEILIQGNHREKIQELLMVKGYNVKLSGG